MQEADDDRVPSGAVVSPSGALHRFESARQVHFPVREFLYTQDQMAVMLGVSMVTLKSFLFYEGVDSGIPAKKEMIALNIASPGEKPDWRVTERIFVSWLRRRGIRVSERRA